MGDEADFHLNNMMAQQNCRLGAFENPRELHKRLVKKGDGLVSCWKNCRHWCLLF